MEIKELSIEEKIGQMIIIGMETNCITDRIRTMIQKYKIGGIILYRKNFSTYSEMLKLIKDLKDLNKENKIPLFISIDQEGGRVNRMPKEIENLPAPNKIAKIGDEELTKQGAEVLGQILKKSGYNLNFAPVLDLKRFGDNHSIGDRSFGSDKEIVAKNGVTVMKELQKQGIIPVIKHFPGHGATTKDSHYMLPIINKKIQELEKQDMYPFEQAIKNGAEAILVGHLLIRGATGIFPASLSRKFISRYLRKKYKYNGLVVTDDLRMRAIRLLYGPDLAVKKAFQAGNDVIVFRYKQDEEKRVIENVIKLAKKGKIRESRINKSVQRIVKLKEKYGVSDTEEVEGINIEEINQKVMKIKQRMS